MTQEATPSWQDTVAHESARLLDSMREVAPQITEAFVKYVWATGVTGIIIATLMFFAGVAAMTYITGPMQKFIEHWDDGDRLGSTVLAMIFGPILLCGGSLISFSGMLPRVLAPEGAAVMMALQALSGGGN